MRMKKKRSGRKREIFYYKNVILQENVQFFMTLMSNSPFPDAKSQALKINNLPRERI